VAEHQAWLDKDEFKNIVANAPLISIDLIVENEQGEYLLGLRNNRPAQGYWFVPGGRVLKNESLDQAFKRLTKIELGVELERSQKNFQGVYEHFYQDSFFGETVSTHYVVLAYKLTLTVEQTKALPKEQHQAYRWWPEADIKCTAQVHSHSQAYWL